MVPADREVIIVPNGAVPDAGWALARLNDGSNMESQSFAYPETSNPVRLYLIDTAVAHTGTWFAGNQNLKSYESHLVRGSGDPTVSSAFNHGTKLLSLIAGPETGGALGTPLHVVNYDVYPNGEGSSTHSGLLASAISAARLHHLSNPGMPGVVCIASGSTSQADSSLLLNRVNAAVSAGLTVIVSAGNLATNVSNYIPASYGTTQGVVCVGASSAANGQWPGSNFGTAVDLFAPGENVRVLNFANPQPGAYELMSGTSPAAALAASAAIIELSNNPQLTPAEVEAALTTGAYPASPKSLIQVQPSPGSDSDGDGSCDLLEVFAGSNPADSSIKPTPLKISHDAGVAQFNFPISASLFDPENPFLLSNGATWKILCSTDLNRWEDAPGTLTALEATDSEVSLNFKMQSSAGSCFLRIEIIPAP